MATTMRPVSARPQRQQYDLADISIVLLAGIALAFVALFLCTMPLAGKMAGSRDFVAYYATGRQLVQHADPYDADAIRRIERASGLSVDGVLLMRNPPWALPLAYPLGLFNVRVSAVLWTIVLLGCMLIPVYLVRRLHGSLPNQIHWLGLSFIPSLMCLTMGQTSLFALLGLTLFLRYHKTHPFCAGAALWLCSLKPHLLVPFAAVLMAWIVVTRSYRLLAGAAVALAASSLLTWAIDPSAFAHYTALMRSPKIVLEFVPCLSDAVRFAIDKNAIWLQYLPAALCSVWAVIYFWRRRHRWDWLENGGLLVLVSLVSAPYSFVYDQSLAIPAILDASYRTRHRKLLVVLVGLLLAVGAQATKAKVTSLWYLWTSPAWLIWYVVACAPVKSGLENPQSAPLPAAVHN